MQITRWNRKRIIFAIAILLLIFVMLSCRYHRYEIDATLRNTKPEDVWEFVADFSKMRKLNPTM